MKQLRREFMYQDFEDAENVKGFDFSNSELQNINFIRANLEGANFKGSNLKNANFQDANLENVNFDRANLEGANLEGVNLKHITFDSVNFKGASFNDSDCTASLFDKCNFCEASFESANFRYSQLMNTNLTSTTIKFAEFEGVDLKGANLSNADMSNAYFTEADFTDANLTDANLSNTDFTNANFTNANLTNANLTNSNFTNTILTNADLSTSNLENCDFDGSNFEDAIIHHRTTYKLLHWLESDVDTMSTIKVVNKFDKHNVFDFVHGSIPISEVDDEHVIFYVENQLQGFAFPRNALLGAYTDRTSIFISCNNIIPVGAVSIVSVIPYHLFFRINLTMAMFVPIDSLKALLLSDHKEWHIKNTGNTVNFSASIRVVFDDSPLNIFGERIDLVSKDHCQKGTEQKLYSLTPIEFFQVRKKGGVGKSKKKNKKKNYLNHRKTVHNKMN